MKKLLLLLILAMAMPASAQVVHQGQGGDSAWKITFGGTDQPVTVTSGTVTFTNVSIQIGGSLPTGSNTIGAVNLAQYTPVSGRLPVDGSGVTQPISAASLPLPTGATTEATLATRLADATFTGRINTQGQKTMSASTPVVIASDQSIVPIVDIDGCGTTNYETNAAMPATDTVVTSTATCVDWIYVTNIGTQSTTVTIKDNAGSMPFTYINAVFVPPNSQIEFHPQRKLFTGGIRVQAGVASVINYAIKGIQ